MKTKIAILIEELQHLSSDKYKQNVVRMGIPEEHTLGVPTVQLRKIAAGLKKENGNKEFVRLLWETEYHEAKIVATLLMKKLSYSPEEIPWFMDRIFSWDLCDLFCKTCLIDSKEFDYYIRTWITEDKLYYKRAAFTLTASFSTHAVITHKELAEYLMLCTENCNDERLHVKKAASWALRELGKIDIPAKEMSIEAANKLIDTGEKANVWIGRDALKELTLLIPVAGRNRLISKKSKMGQMANL